MATSKKRYRATGWDKNGAGVSPWFDTRQELNHWLDDSREPWTKDRVYIAEGSAIRNTKASDARKSGHTHPPGATRCRVCGV